MTNKIFIGNAWLFGDHVDTDIIIPSRFLVTDDEIELGEHAFTDIVPKFYKKITKGDILIAGRNFGCGSSREHAPLAIRGSGISCIIAESYARTFFRNCINRGIFAIELENVKKYIRQGDEIELNIITGVILNHTTGERRFYIPFPDFVLKICEQNGLFNFIQNKLSCELDI
jgi:3-isopropylmalate/(R)-2-methylmalate dehydratase small subunit